MGGPLSEPYFCVACGFHTHQKTQRLKALIGERAYFIPTMLWDFATLNQRNGDFSSYTAQDFERIFPIKPGEGAAIRRALFKVRFIDPSGRLHNWKKRNAYFTTDHSRFKKAAQARYREEDAVCRAAGLTRGEWFDLARSERRRLMEEHRAKLKQPGTSPTTGSVAAQLPLTAEAPEKKAAGPASSKKTWELKQRIEHIDVLLKTHRGNSAHANHDKLAASEFRVLKAQRERLLKESAGITPEENKKTKNA